MLTLPEAVSPASIDYETLVLLFSMMIVIGMLRLSGAFERWTRAAAQRIRSPLALLAATIGLSGLLSAFLVNDIVCVALTPLVLHVARRMRCDPVPPLIAVAAAANVGSAGTITGNPQNMIIGVRSGIPYGVFALHLLPVVLAGLVVTFAVIALLYRRALVRPAASPAAGIDDVDALADLRADRRARSRPLRRLRRKAIIVTIATIILFCAGLPIALVAVGAAAMLLVGRLNPRRIYGQIDWSVLVMFVGLFIVVHGFQLRVVDRWRIEDWGWVTSHPVTALSLTAAGLSNLVSNVPAVLLLEPLVRAVPAASRQTAWLALAMSSTFAGNLTILGSVANLIVAERARREGVVLTFSEYLRAGVPVTILTLALGIGWLWLTG
jgi:Na+/H+ antiporter NhaD/arsenite permease-like protein